MKKEHLSDALNMLSDDIIEETDKIRTNSKPKRRWGRPIAAAACICLIVAGVLAGRIFSDRADGVTIPKREVSLSAEQSADMLGFFIYQGNCYVHYDRIYDDADIIGKHLGAAMGLIDEWTPQDGYVELAGSVKGDFYEVKGYDPSFMLCMKDGDGSISLFVCDTGLTLKYGSELYTDRLHLAGNYASVQYESHDSWFNSRHEMYQLNASDDLIRDLIDGLNAAEFVPYDETENIFNETESYHLYFKMRDGTTVRLLLWKDGYVLYQGLWGAFVQLRSESYDKLLEVLENHTGAVPVEPRSVEKTTEDCVNDPELGRYVPSYVPKNMKAERVEILYYIDPETAKKTGTKELTIEYSDSDDAAKWYAITVTWTSEYGKNGWAGPMIDASELKEDSVSKKGSSVDSMIMLGVWYGNVSVVLTASNLDTETAYQILRSVDPSSDKK